MALTYTVFLTETLEGGQVRIYQGYEVSGVGVILNMLLKMTIAGQEVRLFDEEVFVPGATAAAFAGMVWTLEDSRDLGTGQKRYVRSFSPSTGGKVIELYRTVKQNIPSAFEMMAQAQLYCAQNNYVAPTVPTRLNPNITPSITGTSSPFAPTFIPELQATIVAKANEYVQVVLGCHDLELSSVGMLQGYMGFCLDGQLVGNVVKSVHWYADGPTNLPLPLVWTLHALSAGSHTIYPYASKWVSTDPAFDLRWPYLHINRGL